MTFKISFLPHLNLLIYSNVCKFFSTDKKDSVNYFFQIFLFLRNIALIRDHYKFKPHSCAPLTKVCLLWNAIENDYYYTLLFELHVNGLLSTAVRCRREWRVRTANDLDVKYSVSLLKSILGHSLTAISLVSGCL